MSNPIQIADKIVAGNNEFALDLYGHLARTRKANLFFSPYSISSALAMVFAGAGSPTAQEMASVLRFPMEQDDVPPGFARLNEWIFRDPDAAHTMNVANRLWVRKGYRLNREFPETLRTYYGAELEQLDFAGQPAEVCEVINRWVEEQTAGKISNLISPATLSELTNLLLVNAVYFKGAWSGKFDEADTTQDPFYFDHGSKVAVQMMYQQASLSYAQLGSIQLLELPYGNRELSMIVLLPARADDLASLEAALSVSNVDDWLSEMVPQWVDVYLPKFRLAEQFALANVLQAMGMATAFDLAAANFLGITDNTACIVIPLCISEVLHKACVEVNEEGTEAAAGTADTVSMCSSALHQQPPPVPVFRADHPFLFMIRQNRTGSILFMGRVAHPED